MILDPIQVGVGDVPTQPTGDLDGSSPHERLETPASQGQSNSWSQGEKAFEFPVQLIHGDVDVHPGPHAEATGVKVSSLEEVRQCDSPRFEAVSSVRLGVWLDTYIHRLIG